jgi:signal transduction histidine kinase
MLDDLGILATINWFCREFQMIYSDIRIEKQVAVQENEVPEPLKMVIFRVLQEAMNNIAKHSNADLVHLCFFRKTDAAIALTVEDNGRGFDLEKALSLKNPEKRFGITSMKERTELTGGSFAIKSTPGAGTAISASWPQDSSIQEQKKTIP